MNDILDLSDIADAMGSVDERPVEIIVHEKITNGDTLDILPAADAFPLMDATDEEGFAGLVEDIKKHHVNDPIRITKDGLIVDGRNRIAAIRKALSDGVTPTFNVEVLNKPLPELNAWIISTNLHRRHLTTSQRAMLASDLVTTQPKNTGGAVEEKTTVAEAAKMTNVSERQVKSANQVKTLAKEVGAPEIVEQVKAGTKTVTAAQSELKQAKEVASPPPPPAIPAAKKASAAGTPKPKAPAKPKVKKPQAELTEAQLSGIKDLLPQASQPQLMGLRRLIDVALGGDKEAE